MNVLRDVLGHAGIRKGCLDSIVNGQYAVISKALIAKSISVDVKDKSGRSIDLSVAATTGQVAVSGGASAGANVEQDVKTNMATPMVLGVFFFPASVFKTETAFTEPVVFSPSGELTATVSGNGGLGALPQQSRTVKAGEPLAISGQGGESSECHGDFERTYSMSNLSGAASIPDPQTFDVTLNGTIGGGHYATGTCIAGQLVGKVGHDNGVSLVSTFSGYNRTIVRSDDARNIIVRGTSLPGGTTIEVRDPSGNVIPASGPPNPRDSSVEYNYPISGAGVYVVAVRWTIPRSVNGAGREALAYRTNVKVEVR